jgi:UDP-N-acetylmuramate dehydrogenase
MISILDTIPLSQFTTIGLGGPARFFLSCTSVSAIREALEFAASNRIPVQVLGGGSNIIFRDEGFDGLVLKVDTRGIRFLPDGNIAVAAGEIWDTLVRECVRQNLSGIECLSGIPGSVGGTPIQNVGAYGQEVSETITGVTAIDRTTLEHVRFTNTDCRFGYRRSRFNGDDANRFVITEVNLLLREFGPAEVRYPELQRYLSTHVDLSSLAPGAAQLTAVRSAVLALRARKSMVIHPDDPNSRSAGSFFKNPVVAEGDLAAVEAHWRKSGHTSAVPTFPAGDQVKIPAAWLVEQSGFPKGYRLGRVGISSKHALALVNYGGTTRELLDLAERIASAVFERFGVRLEREPVLAGL